MTLHPTHEALLYKKEENNRTRCLLCRHNCLLSDGQSGICRARKNVGGSLVALTYGLPVALSVDPIEKKPLFHYLPGSHSYSLATVGCNFRCPWCQNWDIAQSETLGTESYVKPEEIIVAAKKHNCKSVSYTYTEPTVFFEYALDVARLAKDKGLGNVFVTNGYMTRDAIDMIAPYLAAANVDLKAFRDDTYKRLIKANLDGVCDSIKYMFQKGIWIEVTTLIIPGINDDPSELADLAQFIAGISKDMPWHISRFFPNYKFDQIPPTPIDTLTHAAEIGKKAGLHYVYVGNAPELDGENTKCHKCKNMLIKRLGYSVSFCGIKSGACPKCDTKIAGIF